MWQVSFTSQVFPLSYKQLSMITKIRPIFSINSISERNTFMDVIFCCHLYFFIYYNLLFIDPIFTKLY